MVMSVPCSVVTTLMSSPRLPQHLLRDPGAGRVRNRVMAVQQVEPVGQRDLVHPHGEREVVGRILEQRISADVDFVEIDARQKRREAERLLIRDEVNLVATPGERDPELGRDGARSAVRRIAGDADLHARAAASDSASPNHRATAPCQSAAVGSRRVTRVGRQLVPEPGALPLRVLPRRDQYLVASRRARPSRRAPVAAPRRSRSRSTPARSRESFASAPHLVGPPVIEHRRRSARRCVRPTPAPDPPEDSGRANGATARDRDAASLIRPPVKTARPRSSASAAYGPGERAPGRSPAPSGATRRCRAAPTPPAASRGASTSSAGSSNNGIRTARAGTTRCRRRRAAFGRAAHALRRSSPRPTAAHAAAEYRSRRIRDVDAAVRHAHLVRARRLCRSDIEAAIDLARVGAHDRRPAPAPRATSRSRSCPPRSGRRSTAISAPAEASLNLVPGQMDDRRAPVHVVRGKGRVAQRDEQRAHLARRQRRRRP